MQSIRPSQQRTQNALPEQHEWLAVVGAQVPGPVTAVDCKDGTILFQASLLSYLYPHLTYHILCPSYVAVWFCARVQAVQPTLTLGQTAGCPCTCTAPASTYACPLLVGSLCHDAACMNAEPLLFLCLSVFNACRVAPAHPQAVLARAERCERGAVWGPLGQGQRTEGAGSNLCQQHHHLVSGWGQRQQPAGAGVGGGGQRGSC